MHLLASHPSAIVFPAMFEDFTATDRWTKKRVHCVYQALIVAIATRHADAVDVKFLVDGRTVSVACRTRLGWSTRSAGQGDHRFSRHRDCRALPESRATGRRRPGPGYVLAYDRGDAGASERCRCRHAVCNPGLESAAVSANLFLSYFQLTNATRPDLKVLNSTSLSCNLSCTDYAF